MKIIIVAAVAAVSFTASPTSAQNVGYQADRQVYGALNDLLYYFAGHCQTGNQQACQAYQQVEYFGQGLMSAGAACQQGNQMACRQYQQSLGELQFTYQQVQQSQIAAMQPQAPSDYGTTHADRMQAIQDFGAANTAAWEQNQAIMDQNHNSFIESIWE